MAIPSMAWLSLLALSSSEKETLKNLQTFGSAFGTSALSGKIGVPELIAALQGKGSPPKWLTKFVRWYQTIRPNEHALVAGLDQITKLLDANGIKMADVMSLVEKFAPVAEIELPESDDPRQILVGVLDQISQRVDANDDEFRMTGIVQCTKCNHTFVV